MSSTIISYLTKIFDGVSFYEDFENDNFVRADGWVTIQGVPAVTDVQARGGIKSWDNTAPGLPVAKKIISDSTITNAWMASVWFYDDASKITDEGPFFKVGFSGGGFVQVGVRNSVSTTKYVMNPLNDFDEDSFAVTGTAYDRSTGWHRFDILRTVAPGRVIINVDGGLDSITHTLVPGLGTPSEIYLNSNTVGGTGNSFGYFDELNLFRHFATFIFSKNLSDVRNVNLYDSSNAIVASTTASSGVYWEMANYTPLVVWPQSTFVEFSQNEPYVDKSAFRSTLTRINPGDRYQFNEIDFGRKVQTYDPGPTSLTSRNMSASGLVESFTFAHKDQLTFSVSALPTPFEETANNWFHHARFGNPFFLMIDSSKDVAFGFVSATALSNTSTLTIGANLGTNPTDAFAVGNAYVLRMRDNTEKQVLTLASKTSTTLTFNEGFRFNPRVGDYVYSDHLYPFLEMVDEKLGFNLQQPKIPLYSWNQTVRDYSNG